MPASEKMGYDVVDVTLAVLADAANVSREGKLNILGVFDRIWGRSFPVIHPAAQLVIRFECGPAEYGSQKDIKIVVLDADGKQIASVDGQMTIGSEQKASHLKMDHTIHLRNMRFSTPGQYAISILVGGEEKANIPLLVAQLPEQTLGKEEVSR